MAEPKAARRPTVAFAASPYMSPESAAGCAQRLSDVGFNPLEASPRRFPPQEVRRIVEASLALVVLNAEAEGDRRHVHPLSDAIGAIAAAGAFEPPVPVFLMATPTDESDVHRLSSLGPVPRVVIGENFAAIHTVLGQRSA